MIVVVTTISVYLAVYKGAPMDALAGTRADPADDEAERRTPWWRRILPGKGKSEPEPEPEPSAGPEGEPVAPASKSAET